MVTTLLGVITIRFIELSFRNNLRANSDSHCVSGRVILPLATASKIEMRVGFVICPNNIQLVPTVGRLMLV